MQMFPYGWQLPDGSLMREGLFSGMVAAANASYWRWGNPDVQNAYLRQCACNCRLMLHASCILAAML